MSTLLFLMGLTGVGKSTAVRALRTSGTCLTLLPNRRALTDELIIPEVQRAAGEPVQAVKDRLERFDMTKRYRETHPGGMVHALGRYLERHPHEGADMLAFDNLRGVDEAKVAVATFLDARFILLDAPPLTRVSRLIERRDAFDQVEMTRAQDMPFDEQLMALEGFNEVFDAFDLALELQGRAKNDVLKAVYIVLSEARNYDMSAAAMYLRKAKDEQGFLYLDTTKMSVDEVRAHIQRWL